MRFSDRLREQSDNIFKAVFDHPFIRGIAQGEVKKEALIHYVKQDYEYLNAMIQVRGLGIAKCDNREDMAVFNEGISFILNSEIHPHNNFCDVAGVQYEDLQGYPLAPTAHHYKQHMLAVAYEGTLAELIAASLPCPWIYLEVGQHIIENVRPDEKHPFYDWIMFYGSQEMPRMQALKEKMDTLAEQTSKAEQDRITQHFLQSCQLEYLFFDMAYNVQDWPVDGGITPHGAR